MEYIRKHSGMEYGTAQFKLEIYMCHSRISEQICRAACEFHVSA